MKLVRFGSKGREKPGLIDREGRLRDLSPHCATIGWEELSPAGLKRLSRIDPATLPVVRGKPRLGVPFTGISKIVGVGLNYRDHAKETGAAIPTEPVLFMKATTAINGPFDDIVLPRGSTHTDWEAELGVVVGKTARYVEESQALSHVAGYVTFHDVSERDFQKNRGGSWDKGKGCDSFAPIGPWLVTHDEIPDPQSLRVWCEVNGERRQDGNTADMIFPVAYLVSYISQFMTLNPGDVICTGTPAGVGMGMKPPRFLKAGDVVRICVEGLGEQCQTVVAS
ncbi:fumarylacetoacetate hydrolase family protein [Sulfuricystis multivorans]|uniref:fumarylacetoacetate hydrolase family protein n=1 Tax=Sulfuricystis multivorans TaxID=2211108 RepID=UPI000F823777|nr:fumarylacetoacetate hydrolase family protein [Sulfuricystis multivorans]